MGKIMATLTQTWRLPQASWDDVAGFVGGYFLGIGADLMLAGRAAPTASLKIFPPVVACICGTLDI